MATAIPNLIMCVMPVFASLSRSLLTIDIVGARFSTVASVNGFGGCLSVVFLIMLCLCPVDANKVAWLSDPSGSRSYDVAGWGSEIVFPFFSDLYTAGAETPDTTAASCRTGVGLCVRALGWQKWAPPSPPDCGPRHPCQDGFEYAQFPY